MDVRERVSNALVWLRYGVFVVMVVWTIDKFLNPGHAAGVFENFYGIAGLDRMVLYGFGAVELLIVIGFVLGVRKTTTYGLVLVFHAISTVSSFPQYLDPFNNLLFFAAWPMLAACYVLFVLRDLDTRWTLENYVG